MIQHGKKINKTKRYVTYDDIRKEVKKQTEQMHIAHVKALNEVYLMALRDYLAEHCPKINWATAVREFSALIDKYAEDYANGEFQLYEVKKYNRDV